MKRHILLLEDDIIQAESLKKMVLNYSIDIELSHVTSLTQAKKLLENNTIFDAFFLDISLDIEHINQAGLQFAEQIQSMPRYQRIPILFITAFPEHVYSAINQLHCFAYLLKPYTQLEVHKQLNTLFENRHNILLKTSENIYIRLPLDSLQYIQSHGRYLTFVTTSSSYRSRQYTLKKLLQLLPSEFVRCHKSYIINQTFVNNFDFVNHFAHMIVNDEIIPLSRTFRLP